MKNPDYHILSSTVISNEREVHQDGNITYMPVYFVMFMENDTPQNDASEYIFWLPRSDNINDLYNTRLLNILREEAGLPLPQAA